jgi:hypothetical protein
MLKINKVFAVEELGYFIKEERRNGAFCMCKKKSEKAKDQVKNVSKRQMQ